MFRYYKRTWSGMLQGEIFVFKLVSIDGLSTSSVVVCEVAALTHEVRNNPVREKIQIINIQWTKQCIVRLMLHNKRLPVYLHSNIFIPVEWGSLKTETLFSGAKRAEILRCLGDDIGSQLKEKLFYNRMFQLYIYIYIYNVL